MGEAGTGWGGWGEEVEGAGRENAEGREGREGALLPKRCFSANVIALDLHW